MTSLCEKTGHLIRLTKTDRGSGDQYAHCQICGCAVVKGSWNTPWKQPKAEDDLNNVRYKANYRYDTKLTEEDRKNNETWVGLTDEELRQCIGIGTENSDWNVGVVQEWLRKVEAKLKEKNNG